MKRTISLVLASILSVGIICSLVSCGSNTSSNDITTTTEPRTIEANKSENVETETETETEIETETETETKMDEEARINEDAFISRLKSEHPDWYEDYVRLSKVIQCYGKSINDVEKIFELEESFFDGNDCYKLTYDSWLGIDGRYVLTFLNEKVMSIEFIIGSNAYGDDFDLLLENMEEFLGQTAKVEQSGYDYDYNWTDNFHFANFYMYRYVEGNLAHGGIMFTQNSNYDFSLLN